MRKEPLMAGIGKTHGLFGQTKKYQRGSEVSIMPISGIAHCSERLGTKPFSKGFRPCQAFRENRGAWLFGNLRHQRFIEGEVYP